MTQLRKMMVLCDMKCKDLCDATGLSRSSVSKYMSGEREPSLSNAKLIAKALNCKIDDLFRDE